MHLFPEKNSEIAEPECAPSPIDYRRLGAAAEALVYADLSMYGCNVSNASEGLRYDLIADLEGRLLRVQVKSVMKRNCVAIGGCYTFQNKTGKGSKNAIGVFRAYVGHVDLLAFVALDLRSAFYILPEDAGYSVTLLPADFREEKRLMSLESAITRIP